MGGDEGAMGRYRRSSGEPSGYLYSVSGILSSEGSFKMTFCFSLLVIFPMGFIEVRKGNHFTTVFMEHSTDGEMGWGGGTS